MARNLKERMLYGYIFSVMCRGRVDGATSSAVRGNETIGLAPRLEISMLGWCFVGGGSLEGARQVQIQRKNPSSR